MLGEELGEEKMVQAKTRRADKALTAAKVNGNLEPGRYHDDSLTSVSTLRWIPSNARLERKIKAK